MSDELTQIASRSVSSAQAAPELLSSTYLPEATPKTVSIGLDTASAAGVVNYIIAPATPSNNDVLVYSAGNWIGQLIVNANISSTAGIAVSKLAPGSGGQLLQTINGVPTWSTFTSASPSGAAGGDLSGTYPNPTIANLAPSKIAPGFSGQFLSTVGGVTTWVTTTTSGSPPTGPAGGDLTGTYPNPTISNLPIAKLAPGANTQIIKTLNGIPTWTTDTSGGSSNLNYYNILDYGASPSASGTVNTGAIQTAINAANTAGGGTVLIPSGIYNVAWVNNGATRIVLSNTGSSVGYCLQIKSNVNLLGIGNATLRTPTHTFGGGDTRGVIADSGSATNWTIRNLVFDGNSAGQTLESGGQAISIGYCSFWIVENCEFKDFNGKCIAPEGESATPFRVPNNYLVKNNYAHNCGGALMAFNGGASRYQVVGNRAISAMSAVGAEVLIGEFATGHQPTDGLIAHNYFYDWGTCVVSGDRLTCIGNHIIHTDQNGGAGIALGGTDNIVSNNYIDVGTGGNNFGIEMYVFGGTDIIRNTVQNNIIKRAGQTAIGVGVAAGTGIIKDITIDNNTIYGGTSTDNPAIGVSNVDGIKISNNTIRDGSAYGITTGSAVLRASITDNNLIGNRAAIGGSGTIFSNNYISTVGTLDIYISNGVVSTNTITTSNNFGGNGTITIRGNNTSVIGNTITNTNGGNGILEDATWNNNFISNNKIVGATTGIVKSGANTVVVSNPGTRDSNISSGATSISDGGTITHGLGAMPAVVTVTSSVAAEMVAVTARTSTTFTVAIKTGAGGAGTTQTVFWRAEL